MRIESNGTSVEYPLTREELEEDEVYSNSGYNNDASGLAESLYVKVVGSGNKVRLFNLSYQTLWEPSASERFRKVEAKMVVE